MQKDQCTYSSDCRTPRQPVQCCDDLAFNYIGNCHWSGQCPFTAFHLDYHWIMNSFFVLKEYLSQQRYCKKCLSCNDCREQCMIWNSTLVSNISAIRGSFFNVWSGKCVQCPIGQFLSPLGCTQCSAPSYSYFTGPGTILNDCPWSCISGYYREGQMCYPCSTQTCIVGQYRSPCTSLSDGICRPCTSVSNSRFITSGNPFDADNCEWICNTNFYSENEACLPCDNRTCPIGQYMSKCSPVKNSQCTPCTTKPGEVLVSALGVLVSTNPCQTTSPNQSLILKNSSFYVAGTALTRNSCPWQCSEGFYESGGDCIPCTRGACPDVGQYRLNCTATSDSVCVPCSPVKNTFFDSFYNCSWKCNSGLFSKGNRCVQCNISDCPLGQYVSTVCGGYMDRVCDLCDSNDKKKKPENARYVQTVTGECNWLCNENYYHDKSDDSCKPCTQSRSCSTGFTLVGCTRNHDSYCTRCDPGHYEQRGAGISGLCLPCSDFTCAKGLYRSKCSQYADAFCASCTLGPAHARFTSAGIPYNADNCSWSCPPSYELFDDRCLPCMQGKYSSDGLKCVECSAGKYSTAVLAIGSSTCQDCLAGQYLNVLGATSEEDCLSCSVGTYQESTGKINCTYCPINTYGTLPGASSLMFCLACPSTTDTRGQTGQAFLPSCLCTSDYYRLNEDDRCHPCPRDLVCYGNETVSLLIPNSNWTINGTKTNNSWDVDTIYKLEKCPAGYLFMRPTGWPYSDDVAKAQSCTPCPAGQECTDPPCFERCALCKPGTYKGCAGTQPCSLCEVGTYQDKNGSTGCQLCPSGFSTRNTIGQTSNKSCTCDTGHYRIQASSSVCTVCPVGLTCFGNETIVPKPVPVRISEFETSVWKPDFCGKEEIYFLVNCPKGYYIAQTPCDPEKDSNCQTPCNQNAQQKCVKCPIGQDCTSPPCVGKCVKCSPGYWKASKYPSSENLGFYMNAFMNPEIGTEWISEPCAACPVNTYRMKSEGTEVGSCVSCPPRSTTDSLLARTSIENCKCEGTYYLSVNLSQTDEGALVTLLASSQQITFCQTCPVSAMCADRTCALGSVCMNKSNARQCQDMQRTRITSTMCPLDDAVSTTAVIDSEWQVEGYHWRLTECPAGYTYKRDLMQPEGDECSPCLPGTYLAEPTNDSRVTCLPCPVGATCPGRDQVNPSSGYWTPEGGRRAGSGSSGMVRVFKCPIGACNGSVCLNNRVGPVCGLCPNGFALSTAGCIECPNENSLGAFRILAIVICSVGLFILWVCISWDHLLPESVRKILFNHMKNLDRYKKKVEILEKKFLSIKEGIETKVGLFQAKMESINSNMENFKGLVPYVKINITFYQVLGSFLTFNVRWPSLLLRMFAVLKSTVFLDLFSLPGVSCLWMGASFQSRLLLYTIVPVVAIIGLSLPLLVQFISIRLKPTTNIPMLWDSIFFRFQKNINVFLFLIYSVVSVVTLEAFNCSPPGLGLLTADLRVECPARGSFLVDYSIAFIIIFPVGIPIFVLISMILIGVPTLVKDKRNAAIVRALCNHFIRKVSAFEKTDLTAIELHQLGEIFGKDVVNQKSKAFEKKMKEVYRTYIDRKDAAESDSTNVQLLERFMKQQALMEEKVSKTAFEKLYIGLVLSTQVFTGMEDGETLTRTQAAYLLAFCKRENGKAVSKTQKQGVDAASESLANLWKQKIERVDKLQNSDQDLRTEVFPARNCLMNYCPQADVYQTSESLH
jgi:hypothetical protein